MNLTSTSVSYNRVLVYGKVLEKNKKTFQYEDMEREFVQLVLACQFHDLYHDKILKHLHVTNVWNPPLLAVCDEIDIGDYIEVESYIESLRNKKDPTLFYHKLNATKIVTYERQVIEG